MSRGTHCERGRTRLDIRTYDCTHIHTQTQGSCTGLRTRSDPSEYSQSFCTKNTQTRHVYTRWRPHSPSVVIGTLSCPDPTSLPQGGPFRSQGEVYGGTDCDTSMDVGRFRNALRRCTTVPFGVPTLSTLFPLYHRSPQTRRKGSPVVDGYLQGRSGSLFLCLRPSRELCGHKTPRGCGGPGRL